MSQINPYESFLTAGRSTSSWPQRRDAIAEYLEVLGPKQSTNPAPGKWSAAEIVSHLADCEIVFGFRLRQTIAEDNPTIQPFDQDKWAAQYPGMPAALALETFSALRKWNLLLIQSALPAAGGRTMTSSRARHNDLPNCGRNHGRARPESSRAVAPHRRAAGMRAKILTS